MSEYFGMFNNKIFKQQQRFNANRNCKTLKNFIDYANSEATVVTQNHLIWAELTSFLKDYEKLVNYNLSEFNKYL